MRILVTADFRMLSEAAAELIVKAVRGKAGLVLGLPTGRTPVGMYEELVEAYRKHGLDFSRIRTFNLDEYLGLEPTDPNSFHAYMHREFFDHVNIPPENVYIPAQVDGYEEAIQKAGGIDLLVVGIGGNGHIAFNEPGSGFA